MINQQFSSYYAKLLPVIMLPAALWFKIVVQQYVQPILFSLMPEEILLATTRSLLSTAWNPLVLAGLVREPGYRARDKFGTKL